MVQQTANVSMMKTLRGRSATVSSRDFWVGHQRLHQGLQMRILKRADKLTESQPQFIDVLGGLGKIIGEIHLGIAQSAQLVDCKLEPVLILIEQSLDFEKV